MKVILSTDSIRYPLTGVGRYTSELARRLPQSAGIEALAFLHGRKLTDSIPEPGRLRERFSPLRESLSGYAFVTEFYRKLQGRAKARAVRGKEDWILHGPNYYLPDFRGRSIVTIHDVSIYRLAHFHRADRVRYMHKEVALSLQRAARVITVSEFSRREIMAQFGLPGERIRAIPLGSDATFHPRAAAELALPLREFGLSTQAYCLYVGTIEPRKNIAALLDAYERLPAHLRTRYPLVLAGYRGWNSEAIHERMRAGERDGWLRYLGFVAEEALPLLFAGARLFVFPSSYEGFGLPVLEAMASGVPVVCSNAASLLEVAGDAAATCAPDDVVGLCERITTGMEDEAWRHAAIEKGLVRAAGFSWARCIQATSAVYAELAGH